jgi:predicted nucleic acid-binding protein
VASPPYLIDTNILLRIARRDDPAHSIVDGALARLAVAGSTLCYTHQNIAEFWNVATRPADRNGFGLKISDVDVEVRAIEQGVVLLPDSEAIYHEWRRLVVTHSVSGVKVHDARLAAAMKIHGIKHLLTLNPDDFARYADVTVVHPGSVAYSGQ